MSYLKVVFVFRLMIAAVMQQLYWSTCMSSCILKSYVNYFRRYIMFAAEPVLGSLANVLGDYPSDISANRTTMFNVS